MIERNLEYRFGAVEVTDFAAGSGFEVPVHSHPGPHACYVQAGGIWEEDCDASVWCPAGTVRLSSRDDSHVIRFGREGARCLVFHIRDPADLDCPVSSPHRRRIVRSPLLERQLNVVWASIHRNRRNNGTPVETEVGRLLSLADLHASPVAPDVPAWLTRARSRLAVDFPSRPELSELAADASVHPVHLSRSFRRFFGTTMNGLVQLQRLTKAHELVVESGLGLSGIAHRTGYSDQAHMTRAFRRWLGRTPGRIRRETAQAPVDSDGNSG